MTIQANTDVLEKFEKGISVQRQRKDKGDILIIYAGLVNKGRVHTWV